MRGRSSRGPGDSGPGPSLIPAAPRPAAPPMIGLQSLSGGLPGVRPGPAGPYGTINMVYHLSWITSATLRAMKMLRAVAAVMGVGLMAAEGKQVRAGKRKY